MVSINQMTPPVEMSPSYKRNIPRPSRRKVKTGELALCIILKF